MKTRSDSLHRTVESMVERTVGDQLHVTGQGHTRWTVCIFNAAMYSIV